MYYLDCVAVVIDLNDPNLNKIKELSELLFAKRSRNRRTAGTRLTVQSRWADRQGFFSTMRTVEDHLTNSMSWVKSLTCWLCQTTLWLEGRGRERLKSCSLQDPGWKTTTWHPSGHSRVDWKEWQEGCREELPVHLEHYLHLESTLPQARGAMMTLLPLVIFCSNQSSYIWRHTPAKQTQLR